MKCHISIIIPVYNSGEYLERCLKSVTSQTLRDIEIFCIDDGSTDNSWNIIQEFAERDDRITALRQSNAGAAVARNRGLERAKGEYIGFVDADDYVDGAYFECLYNAAVSKDADVARAYVSVEWFGGESGHTQHAFDTKESYENHYNVSLRGSTEENGHNLNGVIWLSIYRHSLLKQNAISFVPELRTGQDNIFNLEVSCYLNKVVYTKKKVYYHRVVRDGSLMSSYNYTDDGLFSRALVLERAVAILNSKPDYDKDIYVSRVVDILLFIRERLKYIKSTTRARKIAELLSKAWQGVRYKQEAIDVGVGEEYAVALGSSDEMYRFIDRVSHPNRGRVKALVGKMVKAVLPHGVVVAYKRYKDARRES